MDSSHPALQRAVLFAERFGLGSPVILAPMAGACPVRLSAAVASAGGMGALGALLLTPDAIARWVADFRLATARSAPLQINLWLPDPPPKRDPAHEAAVQRFLAQHGPAVSADAATGVPLDFGAQCEAVLAAGPTAVSSIMGLYPPAFVQRCKAAGIAWFATVTTVAEARAAEAAGADVIVAQGAEAGGHRGAFDATAGRDHAVGLFALLPQVVDAVRVPVVATGGIADARGVAAALLLGASAVQPGTAFLRCPEADIPSAWVDGLHRSMPEQTRLTQVFSGRWGRAIENDYVRAASAPEAPPPAPYPVQRALTAAMRKAAVAAGDLQHMQAWAGQGAGLGQAMPAGALLQSLWDGARALLGSR